MLKYFIIILNFVGLLGYKVLFPGGVSISSDIPTSINPGEDVVVTVTISKGDLSGFAKFTQELPAGFSATLIDGADATFSFKDQTIKYIWVALPAVSEYSFSYKLSVDESVSGDFNIEGTFAYIFDNEKQTAFLPNKKLHVGSGAIASSEIVKGMVSEDIKGVKVRRTTSPIHGVENSFMVELRIDKPGITGFAKIEELIPEGFYASELNSKAGIFTFDNQLVKVIWMAIPEDDEFHMTYELKASSTVSGNQKITGAFSYIVGDESTKYFIAPSTIFIEKDNGDAPVIIIADEGGDFKEKEVVTPEPEPEIVEVVTIPEPQGDVSYRVQVAAGHTPVQNDYFAKNFKLNSNISIDNHEGWIKYTFGNYKVYKECRDKRNNVWAQNKITDAFVTAYNAGSRITVQEALMISNQKWYN
jgi:hypothetical protein